VTYTITVSNEGDNPATHVEVTDYLPVDFCVDFKNVSNNGIYLGDRIIWTDINLEPGQSIDLTFEAGVSAKADGQIVTNLAEVTAMDQTDLDSEPANMDGVPAEDDESGASFTVGKTSDLELIKEVNKVQVSANEEVEFSITVINYGPDPAFGIAVEDILPDGYADIVNISHDGSLTKNKIYWFVDELAVDESVTFTFDARVVHFQDGECDYRNVAQIVESFTFDPDSAPGNDDGDQSEDDEDYEEVELLLGTGACIEINTAAFLEGPYDYDTERMSTDLNQLGYLPGQTPMTFFGTPMNVGQPYNKAPWFYNGNEGDSFVQEGVVVGTNGKYPATATDWVLVSLRTDVTPESAVCTRAALLLRDGTIRFVEDFECCNIDPTLDYYLVIEHRNHLLVMSHIKVPVINGQISYDFRYHNSYRSIMGVGQKEVAPGVYAMFAGNGDQQTSASDDIDINANDLQQWIIDDGLNSSYFLRDFDLSGDVNVQDKGLLLENNGLFSDVPRD
jgi:uncharacterized repeat protein (TIGR01451 family)